MTIVTKHSVCFLPVKIPAKLQAAAIKKAASWPQAKTVSELQLDTDQLSVPLALESHLYYTTACLPIQPAMKLQKVSTLLSLLVLLSIAVLSSTRPAPSEGRGARAPHLQRVSKRTAGAEQDTGEPNIEGPKLMLELFRNLSDSSSPHMTQANIIRSLPYQLHGEQSCWL